MTHTPKRLALLTLFLLTLLATPALAANPGHGAASIGNGTFESGNYAFPAQLDVTGNFIVNTSRLYVNASSGRVGIGTSNPQQSLHVAGTGRAQLSNDGTLWSYLQLRNDATGASWGLVHVGNSSSYDDSFRLVENMSDYRLTVAPGGKTGIGTTSPNHPLHIANYDSLNNTQIELDNNDYSWQFGVRGNQNDAFIIRDRTGGTDRLAISTNGRVTLTTGTGITEFSTDTSLAGSSDDAVPTENAVKTYVDGQVGQSGNVSGTGSKGYVAYWENGTHVTGESSLYYNESTDRLGIGTSSPGAKLEVQGSGAQTVFDADGNDARLEFENSGTRQGLIVWNVADGFRIASENNLTLRAGNTEHMRITEGGSVGIGTSTPDELLDVAGRAVFSGGIGLGTASSPDNNPSVRFAERTTPGGITNTSILWRDSSNYFGLIDPAGNTVMAWEDGGEVGIGTNNPTSKLTVDQAGSGSWNAALEFDYDGTNEWQVVADTTNGARLNFGYNSGSKFYIESDGDITASRIDTGQGMTDVYAMNQDVTTSDAPTFAGLTSTGDADINANNLVVQGAEGTDYQLRPSQNEADGLGVRPTSNPTSGANLFAVESSGGTTRFSTVHGAPPLTSTTSNWQISGNTVWHAGNDGSTSGLDADLLDNLDSGQFLRSDESDTMDAGTTTTLTILSDDTDESRLRLFGNSQGTGILYVGQSSSYGGGIEYNGDASPPTTGAGSDYITLFRRNAGTDEWTARNRYNSNNWDFRGNIDAAGYTESGSNTLSNSISGNAATATALASDGTNCASGNFPLGVDAQGNVQSCTADSDTQLSEGQVEGYVFDADNTASMETTGLITAQSGYETGNNGGDSGLTGTYSYRFGYQEGGAWTSPYPDLVLGYHTGVSIGGHTNYGGTRFFADHPSRTSTVLMSVGDGNNNVDITNNLDVGGITENGGSTLSNDISGDADTVDSLHAGSFIRSDANDNVAAHTEWQDSQQVRLGNGADMRIYHDGSHNRIRSYTGNLYIRSLSHGNQILLQGEDSNGNNRALLYADPDGRAGNRRVEVWGLEVSGNTVMSGDATISGEDLFVGANGGAADSDVHLYDDNSNTWRTLRWDDSNNALYMEDNGGTLRRVTTENIDTDTTVDGCSGCLAVGTEVATGFSGDYISDNTIDGSEIQADVLDFAHFQDTLDLDATTQINLGGSHLQIDLDSSGDFQILDAGTTQHIFYDNGDVRLGNNNEMYVDTSSGEVGIGESNPSARLHVNGQIIAPAGSASAPTFAFPGGLNAGMFFDNVEKDLAFSTNGERLRIGADGYMYFNSAGVSSSTPSSSQTNGLIFSWNHDGGRGESEILYGTGSGWDPQLDFGRWDGTTRTEDMTLDAGRIYMHNIAAGSGTYYLKWSSSSGEVTYQSSSRRFKKNISDPILDTDAFLRMEPKRFQWKRTNSSDVGFIAEQVEDVLPEIVTYKNNSPEGLRYDQIPIYLFAIAKEHEERLDRIESVPPGQIRTNQTQTSSSSDEDELRSRVEALETQLAALKQDFEEHENETEIERSPTGYVVTLT